MEYPKTENLYARCPETKKVGPEFGFRIPEVAQVASWLVTEKIDGMNMRVIWRPDEAAEPSIYGRTDRALVPGDLAEGMRALFTYEKLIAAFSTYKELEDGSLGHFRPDEVVLFGEGFGGKIQSGGHYGPEKRFALFDVVVDGWWFSWDDVVDIARKLGIPHAPVLAQGADLDLVHMLVEDRCAEFTTDKDRVEGVVARTDPYLFTQRGKLLKFKHKVRDL